jgi:hypothetical protein
VEFELIKDDEGPVSMGDQFFSYARSQRAAKEGRDADVGDVVHLWHNSACRAAIVTADDLTTWSLSFLMPGETSWRPICEVEHDEAKADNTWHWPCGGQ